MCLNNSLKICTECKMEKPLGAFAKKGMRSGVLFYDSKCKECRAEYFKKRRKKKLGIKKVKDRGNESPYQTKTEVLMDNSFGTPSFEAVEEWIRKFKLKKYQPTS